jgi:hypothetical protein
VATRPRTNPDASLTPSELPQYRLAANEEAERLEAAADTFAAEARRKIRRSSNYVPGVVLFAASHFFAGIRTKLATPRLRVVLLGIGSAVFLGTPLWIAISPISLSI